VQNDFAYGKSYTSRSCEVNGNIYFRFWFLCILKTIFILASNFRFY
jgi:hypothetical protein